LKDSKKSVSREVGVEIGSICGRYFLNLEHLHYGYWEGGLERGIGNLGAAQRAYVEFLISHIPAGVKTILDVGCGMGSVAKELLGLGYEVDCISPSSFLAGQARALLGDKSEVFECTYEEFESQKRYDLILFAESFQYVDMEEGLEKSLRLLADGGHLLICDIFKKDVVGQMGLGGGHNLSKFEDVMGRHPFRLVEDVDITEQTAPNIDILDDALRSAGRPVAEAVLRFLADRHPVVFKILRWRYRRRLLRLAEKYFDGDISAESFRKFKTYRLFLYSRGGGGPAG